MADFQGRGEVEEFANFLLVRGIGFDKTSFDKLDERLCRRREAGGDKPPSREPDDIVGRGEVGFTRRLQSSHPAPR